jgi:hypothetical protein
MAAHTPLSTSSRAAKTQRAKLLVLKKSLLGIVLQLFPDPWHLFQKLLFLGKP